jgi:hypothetical protein
VVILEMGDLIGSANSDKINMGTAFIIKTAQMEVLSLF